MQILEQLYYGNIRPDVRFHGQNSYISKLVGVREENREKLLESLSEKEKNLFENFNEAQGEIDGIMHYEKFSYGFRLGILLVADAFMGMENLINSDI